jgi:hypothetical protein
LKSPVHVAPPLASIVLKKQKEISLIINNICLQFYFLIILRAPPNQTSFRAAPSGGHFLMLSCPISRCAAACMAGQRFYLFSHSPWDNKKGRTKNGRDLRIGELDMQQHKAWLAHISIQLSPPS